MSLALKDPALLKTDALIGGEWTGADNGETFDITNPATAQTIASVPDLGATETRRAIQAAADAFPGWSGRLAADPAKCLRD